MSHPLFFQAVLLVYISPKVEFLAQVQVKELGISKGDSSLKPLGFRSFTLTTTSVREHHVLLGLACLIDYKKN